MIRLSTHTHTLGYYYGYSDACAAAAAAAANATAAASVNAVTIHQTQSTRLSPSFVLSWVCEIAYLVFDE